LRRLSSISLRLYALPKSILRRLFKNYSYFCASAGIILGNITFCIIFFSSDFCYWISKLFNLQRLFNFDRFKYICSKQQNEFNLSAFCRLSLFCFLFLLKIFILNQILLHFNGCFCWRNKCSWFCKMKKKANSLSEQSMHNERIFLTFYIFRTWKIVNSWFITEVACYFFRLPWKKKKESNNEWNIILTI